MASGQNVPRSKAEHMAAPTNAAGVKKALANPEPSTHGPKRRYRRGVLTSEAEDKADVNGTSQIRRF